jgi:hypothetical protein
MICGALIFHLRPDCRWQQALKRTALDDIAVQSSQAILEAGVNQKREPTPGE